MWLDFGLARLANELFLVTNKTENVISYWDKTKNEIKLQ